MAQSLFNKWPYPINYGKENKIDTDVLILGGGIAGCHAAISASRKGVRVVLIEKGATKWSGNGGAGVDHWQAACTNPCCKVSPVEMTEAIVHSLGGYECGIKRYIQCVEGYEVLLDVEKMGVKIRDVDDEFKGADFRDEETKLLFAYDYENRYTIRVWGHNIKPALYNELKRLGVSIFDRVMVTGLLTGKTKEGVRVLGATGVNTRTGEFYIFKSKATILCIPEAEGIWDFSEPHGFGRNFHDPNCTGDGFAIGWSAGAEFTLLEHTIPSDGNLGYIPYGVGNAHNTWHGCTIIDSKNRELKWYDRDGKEIPYEQRFRPSPFQKFFIEGGSIGDPRRFYDVYPPVIEPNLPDLIRKMHYVLPLYADLPSMPERERRAIFGMMVGNEGKTFILHKIYTEAGFDPNKHLLQVPIFSPEGYINPPVWWYSPGLPKWRRLGRCGGLVVDWDLRTNLEGLYAAGSIIFGHGDHAGAATSGRYAGRKAAQYAVNVSHGTIEQNQIEQQKSRVYAPIFRNDGIRWKELKAGINRVMQDFCGPYKHENTLKIGLKLLQKIKNEEIPYAYASNPHELSRILECISLCTVAEMVIHASMARRSSSKILDFFRIDYPQIDPPEWNKLITIRFSDGELKFGSLPLNYYLSPPYFSSYEENYKAHCSL
jgi:succinate dehydrogenase/fumarate reductase flavoprotein subunit